VSGDSDRGVSRRSPSRLTARPGARSGRCGDGLAPGLGRLGLGRDRDGLLYVPPKGRGRGGAPAPLIVSLHGAGSHGATMVAEPVLARADAIGALILAPDSRGDSWDVLSGGFGPDVAFLDAALRAVFDATPVDPGRLAISGFSDGASYALSVGLVNGDLFSHVLAFSPGFMAPDDQHGQPPIFVSHGTGDAVLDVDRCSRALVPLLEQVGYAVTYAEFDGGHELPPGILDEAFAWYCGELGSHLGWSPRTAILF
jgi:phospholipase/carboxylesterase